MRMRLHDDIADSFRASMDVVLKQQEVIEQQLDFRREHNRQLEEIIRVLDVAIEKTTKNTGIPHVEV